MLFSRSYRPLAVALDSNACRDHEETHRRREVDMETAPCGAVSFPFCVLALGSAAMRAVPALAALRATTLVSAAAAIAVAPHLLLRVLGGMRGVVGAHVA